MRSSASQCLSRLQAWHLWSGLYDVLHHSMLLGLLILDWRTQLLRVKGHLLLCCLLSRIWLHDALFCVLGSFPAESGLASTGCNQFKPRMCFKISTSVTT